MRWLSFFCVNFLLVSSVFCKNVAHRDPRFIRGTYTTTVIDVRTLTSLVPSSCVQVDATLPPCRSIRFLTFPQFVQNQSYIDPEPFAKTESPIQTTPLGWGEYFGVYAPTVTVTETQIVRTVVPDPRIVVTFSVKGCRPMKIPMDLDRCPDATQAVPVSQALPTSTLLPMPTATVPISTPRNTKVIEVTEGTSFSIADVKEIQMNNNLEGSNGNPENMETDRQTRATDPLPF